MAPVLRAALGFWVSSCRCRCCCVEPGRTGSAPLRPERLPICAPGPGPPRPVCGSQHPALPQNLRAEGAPPGWGKGSNIT